MRGYLRHILIVLLIVAPFVAVIAATVAARSAVPRLLAQEVDAGGCSLAPFLQREYDIRRPLPPEAEIEKRCWQEAAARMQDDGASEGEATEIEAAVQLRFRRSGIYAMPIHVRGASVWGRRVWAITLVWERQNAAITERKPPCCRWTLVVEAARPHQVLAESHCG